MNLICSTLLLFSILPVFKAILLWGQVPTDMCKNKNNNVNNKNNSHPKIQRTWKKKGQLDDKTQRLREFAKRLYFLKDPEATPRKF